MSRPGCRHLSLPLHEAHGGSVVRSSAAFKTRGPIIGPPDSSDHPRCSRFRSTLQTRLLKPRLEVVSDGHQRDLAVQDKYGVRYLKYWFDSASGKVFCLVEAPSADAAIQVHREAHGMLADEIFEVEEGL